MESKIHSFAPVLNRVLEFLDIQRKALRALEWGPGESTRLLLANPKVSFVLSIEDQEDWYKRFQSEMGGESRLHLKLIPQPHKYNARCSYVVYPEKEPVFDLALVDGSAYRTECLLLCQRVVRSDGIVLLHDFPSGSIYRDLPDDAPGNRSYTTSLNLAGRQYAHCLSYPDLRTSIFSNGLSLRQIQSLRLAQ